MSHANAQRPAAASAGLRAVADATPRVGPLLRAWRERRRLSQLELALDAEISARHLSFVETGRAQPSREMVLRLAERLDVPLRERNQMLVAAGYAPMFPQRPIDAPALQAARATLDRLLAAYEPAPALIVDRHWTLVSANASVGPLLAGVSRALLAPPANVLRLSLHPEGLAPRIANLPEWRAHLLARLRRQVELTADPQLAALLDELREYPAGRAASPAALHAGDADIVVPLKLQTDTGVLSFLSTVTVFGTPVDVTLSELAVEAFFPADPATADALRTLLARSSA